MSKGVLRLEKSVGVVSQLNLVRIDSWNLQLVCIQNAIIPTKLVRKNLWLKISSAIGQE